MVENPNFFSLSAALPRGNGGSLLSRQILIKKSNFCKVKNLLSSFLKVNPLIEFCRICQAVKPNPLFHPEAHWSLDRGEGNHPGKQAW
jgi:hypothetical protein